MRDTSTRVFSLMCALIGVWVVVYWFYEPAKPPVTFDANVPGAGEVAIRPDPLAQLDQRAGESAIPERPIAKPVVKPPVKRVVNSEPERATEGSRAVAPKFTEYVVERGDTFEVIARKQLGDARYWKAIAAANTFVDPTKLVPGRTVLRIPVDPGNVEGKVVTGGENRSTGTRETAPEVTPSQAPTGGSSFTEYVVKSTDTLSGIAKAFYGKSSAWRVIYEANTGVIDDPDRLKPGVTIRIPKNP